MMKHILVASAVSLALFSLSAVAHEEKGHQPVTTAETASRQGPHAGAKLHGNVAAAMDRHGAGGEQHTHASTTGKPGNAAKVSRTIKVDMTDAMRFNPSHIIVKRGETVRFVVKNSGMLKHEMVLGSMTELKDHARMMREMPEMEHAEKNMIAPNPGKSGELVWQFAKAGKFDFACLQPGHFEAGMTGNVRVQ